MDGLARKSIAAAAAAAAAPVVSSYVHAEINLIATNGYVGLEGKREA